MNISQIEKNISLSPKLKEDPTLENYIALFHAITDKDAQDPNKIVDSRKYLQGLFDTQEADERMMKIDELRKLGAGTEIDHEVWLEKFKKETEKNKNKYCGKKVKVINLSAGTEEIFDSIAAMCEEYNLKSVNVRGVFNYNKSNKIQYKGLTIEKL